MLQNWDAIKRRTKGDKTQADLLGSVPRTLPALMRAAKVQNRARRVGFDWPDVSGALESLDSERAELKEAIDEGDPDAVEEELGDLLFSAVNVSRFLKTDAEQALTRATDKFIRPVPQGGAAGRGTGPGYERRLPGAVGRAVEGSKKGCGCIRLTVASMCGFARWCINSRR